MFDGPIRDHAFWTPRAPAVVLPDRTISYAWFNADIDRMGTVLTALGIVQGCGVVSLGIHAAYLQYVALAALARLGVASSTFGDDTADLRLSDRADDVGPGVIHLHPDMLRPDHAGGGSPLPVLDLAPDALVRVLLSSGTTAAPRRVPFSRQRIDANTLANLRVYGAGRRGLWIPLTGMDSLLGFCMIVLGWSQGAAVANGLPMSVIPQTIETFPEGVIGTTPAKQRLVTGRSRPPVPQAARPPAARRRGQRRASTTTAAL